MRKFASIANAVVWAGAVLLLAACAPVVAPPAVTNAPAASQPTPVAANTPEIVVELTDDSQVISETLPAGTRRITVKNTGKAVHASVFRRLKEGVTPEQFAAAFRENPFASLALTTQLGGPDLDPGASIAGYYQLDAGDYTIVDNAVEPKRFVPFRVEASPQASEQPPAATVAVEMKEYEFVIPAEIKAGKQWWQFTNSGQNLHQAIIVKLAEGKTVDDVIAWNDTQEGPEPFTLVAFWNVMSPGVKSWGELDLPAGTYWLLDFLPDPSKDGMPNAAQGMAKEITATE